MKRKHIWWYEQLLGLSETQPGKALNADQGPEN